MKVDNLMNRDIISVQSGESAAKAAQLLRKHNVGSLVVRGRDGGVKGVLTDRDIITRCVARGHDPAETTVADIMSRNVVTVEAEADAGAAALLMAQNKVRRLPVTEDGRLVGVISIGDVAKAQEYKTEAAAALAEISRPEEPGAARANKN